MHSLQVVPSQRNNTNYSADLLEEKNLYEEEEDFYFEEVFHVLISNEFAKFYTVQRSLPVYEFRLRNT